MASRARVIPALAGRRSPTVRGGSRRHPDGDSDPGIRDSKPPLGEQVNERCYTRFDRGLLKLVGRVLQDIRDERHLSLTQAGILGGFYPTNLIKHERGTRPLSVSCLRSYLVTYGVSWELFGEKLHRLDAIRPREIDPDRLNRLRREREGSGVNRYTGRQAIKSRGNTRTVATRNRAPAAYVVELHSWCQRPLRRTLAANWQRQISPLGQRTA